MPRRGNRCRSPGVTAEFCGIAGQNPRRRSRRWLRTELHLARIKTSPLASHRRQVRKCLQGGLFQHSRPLSQPRSAKSIQTAVHGNCLTAPYGARGATRIPTRSANLSDSQQAQSCSEPAHDLGLRREIFPILNETLPMARENIPGCVGKYFRLYRETFPVPRPELPVCKSFARCRELIKTPIRENPKLSVLNAITAFVFPSPSFRCSLLDARISRNPEIL